MKAAEDNTNQKSRESELENKRQLSYKDKQGLSYEQLYVLESFFLIQYVHVWEVISASYKVSGKFADEQLCKSVPEHLYSEYIAISLQTYQGDQNKAIIKP